MGCSLLSVSVEAEGPSPRPSGPWHFQHSSLVNNSFPCWMLCTVGAGSAGTLISAPAFSVFHRSDKDFIKATRSARFWLVNVTQDGMLELMSPRISEL